MTNKELKVRKRQLVAKKAYADIGTRKQALKRIGGGFISGTAVGLAIPAAYAAYKFPKKAPPTNFTSNFKNAFELFRKNPTKSNHARYMDYLREYSTRMKTRDSRTLIKSLGMPVGAYLGANAGTLAGMKSFNKEMKKRQASSRNKVNKRIYAEDRAVRQHFKEHKRIKLPADDIVSAYERNPAFLNKLVKKYAKKGQQ